MLLKNENQIIRVLKSQGDKALVIDCIKKTMPKWVDGDSLSNFDDCGEDEMYERTDYPCVTLYCIYWWNYYICRLL